MLETFTLETFVPLVGTAFSAQALGADGVAVAVPLTLETAQAGRAPEGDQGRPPFALVFAGPRASPLAQATYPLTHDGLGAFELFVVPISADDEHVRYEAVFT